MFRSCDDLLVVFLGREQYRFYETSSRLDQLYN